MRDRIVPACVPPLDPTFQPMSLFVREYRKDLVGERVVIGVEREDGLMSRFETGISTRADESVTLRYLERIIKFLLWSRGGWHILFGGPEPIGRALSEIYSSAGARRFDVDLMEKVYERPFKVTVMKPEDIPRETVRTERLGGHLDGCRIGFDLGASDYKIAAVQDGHTVFSEELPWNPKDQADPAYHYECIQKGLKRAAAQLPRVDAIGGSTAGVVVNNRMMVASLFRSVPADRYEEARSIFQRLQEAWRVPLQVINDGEVTALAGAMSLGASGMLGIAMGSSEAVGYISPEGHIPGYLDELAFAPVDMSEEAVSDEWSGDKGVGAQYFSQQAVNKLALAAGFEFPDDMPLPERLKEVQAQMAQGNADAERICQTIGIYLGYALPWYAEFYDIRHVLVLGRVLSGAGGQVILDRANEVLKKEFPEQEEKFKLHLPDEKFRRVGQAMAAASLPKIEGSQKTA